MNRFKAWSDNKTEEDGIYVDALDAEEAAILYAEHDEEGQAEGLYAENGTVLKDIKANGHLVRVKTESGAILLCRVGVYEMEPVFAAYEVKN